MGIDWTEVAKSSAALAAVLFFFWVMIQDLKNSIKDLGVKLDTKVGAVWTAVTEHKDDKTIHVPVKRVDRMEDQILAKADK